MKLSLMIKLPCSVGEFALTKGAFVWLFFEMNILKMQH